MTDIHDLDRHIGRYVSLEEGGEGMSGFLVDVADEVDYIPKPVRHVMLDYGYGFRVSEDTELIFPEPPADQRAPEVMGPVRLMHLAMHRDVDCPSPSGVENCTYEGMAVRALRQLRIWRMRQSDAYWQHRFVRRVREMRSDPAGVTTLIEQAAGEGAPEHILDHLQIIATRAAKAAKGQ